MNPAPATPSASRRPLILIVDDMEDIRDLYAAYLSGEGFRPEVATNGFEALSKATVMGPDVIVADSKAAALEAGGDGFLTKPCFPDALADEIRRVLRGWRRSH